jgi:hypothetical protein
MILIARRLPGQGWHDRDVAMILATAWVVSYHCLVYSMKVVHVLRES